MVSLTKRLNNAEDFIAHLNGRYGKTKLDERTLEHVHDTWQEWENQGISRPKDTIDTASAPFERYRAYFDDIITASEIPLNSKEIYFALVRLKSLNAYASTLPNNDKVIVFDENLISFSTAFIVAAMVAVYSNPSEKEILIIEQFILDTIEDFYISQQTDTKKQQYSDAFISIIKKDYKLTEIGSYFSMAFTVFIICHELSHHILGHTTEKCMYAINTNNTTTDLPLNNPSQKEEFDADHYGYKLFLELIEKADIVETAKLSQVFNRAPLLFFEIVNVTEHFGHQYGHPQTLSNSHPTPLKRKKHLLNSYENKLAADGEKIHAGLLNFIQHIKTLA